MFLTIVDCVILVVLVVLVSLCLNGKSSMDAVQPMRLPVFPSKVPDCYMQRSFHPIENTAKGDCAFMSLCGSDAVPINNHRELRAMVMDFGLGDGLAVATHIIDIMWASDAIAGRSVATILHDQKKHGRWDGNLAFVLTAMKFNIDVISFGNASPLMEFSSAVCFLKTHCLDIYKVGDVTQTAFTLYHIYGRPMDIICRNDRGVERRNHFCLLVAKPGDSVLIDNNNDKHVIGCTYMQAIKVVESDKEHSDDDDVSSVDQEVVGHHDNTSHSVKLVTTINVLVCLVDSDADAGDPSEPTKLRSIDSASDRLANRRMSSTIGGTAWLKPQRDVKKQSTRLDKVARAISRAEGKLGRAEAARIRENWVKRGYGGVCSGSLHDKCNGIICNMLDIGLSEIEIQAIIGVGGGRITGCRTIDLVEKPPRCKPSHAMTDLSINFMVKHSKEMWPVEDGFPCPHRRAVQYLTEEKIKPLPLPSTTRSSLPPSMHPDHALHHIHVVCSFPPTRPAAVMGRDG
jgi:hypothetical protein